MTESDPCYILAERVEKYLREAGIDHDISRKTLVAALYDATECRAGEETVIILQDTSHFFHRDAFCPICRGTVHD